MRVTQTILLYSTTLPKLYSTSPNPSSLLSSSLILPFPPSMLTGAVFGSVPHIVQVDDYVDTLAFKVSVFKCDGYGYRTVTAAVFLN